MGLKFRVQAPHQHADRRKTGEKMKAILLVAGLIMACSVRAELQVAIKSDLTEVGFAKLVPDTTRPAIEPGYYLAKWQDVGQCPITNGVAKWKGLEFMTGEVLDSMSKAGEKIHVPRLTSSVLPNGLNRGFYWVIKDTTNSTNTWFAMPVMFDALGVGVARDEATGKCWHIGSVSLPENWVDEQSQPIFWSASDRR